MTSPPRPRLNAHFVLAAIRGFLSSTKGIPGYERILAFQPANQLIVEGLELVLKAMLLKRGKKPASQTRAQAYLYAVTTKRQVGRR